MWVGAGSNLMNRTPWESIKRKWTRASLKKLIVSFCLFSKLLHGPKIGSFQTKRPPKCLLIPNPRYFSSVKSNGRRVVVCRIFFVCRMTTFWKDHVCIQYLSACEGRLFFSWLWKLSRNYISIWKGCLEYVNLERNGPLSKSE